MNDKPKHESLNAGSPWFEKRGGTSWASCRACAIWFPIDIRLVRDAKLLLHCPKCGDRFTAEHAKRVVLAQ